MESFFGGGIDDRKGSAASDSSGEKELRRVIFCVGATEIHRVRLARRAQKNGKAIGLDLLDDKIHRRHAFGAGHILDDETRVSRNIFAQAASDQAGDYVSPAARRETNDDS